jgi:hypothetical protein
MQAITISEQMFNVNTSMPIKDAEAYVAGVVHGDGFCNVREVGLLAKDRDFVESFAIAARLVTRMPMLVRSDREYWVARCGGANGKWKWLRHTEFSELSQMALWVRGMFDSDGNVSCRKLSNGPRSYSRRVAIYKTKLERLETCNVFLKSLGIEANIRKTKNSESHYGEKLVYELGLTGSFENYSKFLTYVGSNIQRKLDGLVKVCDTYQSDLSQCRRESQAIGAETKRIRFLTETLPTVLASMKELDSSGERMVVRTCGAKIRGYHSMLQHFTHKTLLTLSKESPDSWSSVSRLASLMRHS